MNSIIVLDDRATERELLVTVLSSVGHTMLEASTGPQALELARETQPELIIVDLMMPGMDGSEFVRELRADPVVGDTRVVFSTATYEQDEVRRLAQTCGVSQILLKPANPEQIISVITEALGPIDRSVPRILSDEFDREQLRVLNAKLMQKVAELEASCIEQGRLHEDLRQAERRTAESLTLLETLQSNAPVGFGFIDRDLRIRRLNHKLAAVNGARIDQQLGRTIAEVMPDLWPRVEPSYRHVLETGQPVLNRPVQRDDPAAPGGLRHWLTSCYPVRLDDEVIGVGLVVLDITERQQADDFRAVAMETMAEGLSVADAHGRLVFMNAAASRMLGWTEDELRGMLIHDAIHYQHLDGSSYAAKDCELANAQRAGDTLRRTDDAFTRKDGTAFPVSYSSAPLLSGTTLRGSVLVFHDTTEEKAEQTRVQRHLNSLSWVGRIRDALDEHRLVLYSQPILELGDASQRSEELLVRMVDREGEIILPGVFLSVAEKYGQIREIDDWVIMQAMRLAAGGRHLHVNLSADSVVRPDLLPEIERALSETGADPANIVFEITETALMNNIEAGRVFTSGVTELGCGLALDDFGTGYGSFTYLQKLRITYLKIDIAFVRDLLTNTANQHLVKAIVSIARAFGLKTIAEGVENMETLGVLRDYGVDQAQGFYIGRPEPVEVHPDEFSVQLLPAGQR